MSAAATATGHRDLRDPTTWGGSDLAAERARKFLDEQGGNGVLNVSNCDLVAVPMEIGRLTEMTTLYIGENRRLTDLPDTIGGVCHLRSYTVATRLLSSCRSH